jgi:hypothetical protein
MDRLYHENEVVVRDTTQGTVAYQHNRPRIPPDGRVTFSQLFTVAILCVVGIQGLKFITPWYDYLRLKGSMQESVNQAPVLTDGDMVSAIIAKAKELDVPLTPRNIYVDRRAQGGVRLWAEYDVTLTFPLGLSYTQYFRPEVRSARL